MREGRERERSINVREKYQLIGCLQLNLQPFGVTEDAPTN